MPDVFVDQACALAREPGIRALHPVAIDVQDARRIHLLEPGGLLLLGARTRDVASAVRTLRALRGRCPHVTIILCATWDEVGRVPIHKWTRAGADELVTFGETMDVVEVLRIVAERAKAPPPAEELKLLQATRSSSWVLDAVLHGLRNSCGELHPADLARRFGYSVRAFRDYLSEAKFPTPRDVCRCGRFLHLAELIDLGVQWPPEQAQRLGFADAAEMRKKRWQLGKAVRRDKRLAAFVTGFPRLAALLGMGGGD